MNFKILLLDLAFMCLGAYLINLIKTTAESRSKEQVQTDSIALKKANYRTLPYKVQLIKAYQKYYEGTEEVMDILQDQFITGNIDSTAAYAHYLKARRVVDSLYNLEE